MPALTNRLAIGYDNLASGKSIVSMSEASGYAASNLALPRLYGSNGNERWHSASGSLTAQSIDVDLGSAQDIELIGLLGVNLEDDATRRILTDDASNFASPDHDSDLQTGDDGSVFDTSIPPLIAGRRSWPPFGRHLLYFPSTTQTNRYVRVTAGDAGNADNYLSAAVLWVSRILQLPFDWNWEPGPPVVDGEPGLERVYRTHNFTCRGLTTQQQVDVESLFYVMKRTGRVVICPQPLQRETWIHKAWYGVFQGAPRSTRMLTSEELWQISLSFVEVLD